MGIHISLPFGHHHAAKAHADAPLGGSAPRATLEFVDKDGNAVGGRMRPLVPEPFHAEVPSGDSGMDWHRSDPHLSVVAKAVPDAAVAVRARAGGAVAAEATLTAALAGKPSPPAARRVFNPAGTWNLLLVSEMFADEGRFFAFAAKLDAYIRSQAPFAQAGVGGKLRIEALFWKSPRGGLFNTQENGRLVYGDTAVVNGFLAKSGSKGRLTVVLVDLPRRGGAGGGIGRPAWVTVTSAPTERWEAVALHELGHSFGLADEYANADQPTPEPHPLEPNVTDASDPAHAPWAALCTPGHPAKPTCAAGVDPPAPLGIVGTYEGARYHATGRYRPTAECLMQRTDRPFCPVCQAAIARALASA
jgi:hypothetical protein